MPDDWAVVPEPIVSRSSSSTFFAPSLDRWNATDVPTTPPPITTTSNFSTALSFKRRDRRLHLGRKLVLHHSPALHHELDALQDSDIGSRIALHGDQVGELAGFDRADVTGPSHQLGRGGRRCADRLQRGQPATRHRFELLGVFAMAI